MMMSPNNHNKEEGEKRGGVTLQLDDDDDNGSVVASEEDQDDDDDVEATATNRESTSNNVVVLAKNEDKAVGYLRLLVALLLGIVALAVSLSVYFVTKASEQQDFQNDFMDTSGKVVETFGSTLHQRFEILENYAIDMTSRVNAAANNNLSGWPFVTFPDYAARTAKTAKIGSFLDITLLPIVYPDQLEEWNNYSMTNGQWLYESIAWQEGISLEQAKSEVPPIGPMAFFNPSEGTFSPLASEMVAEAGSTILAPKWLSYPAVRLPTYNSDIAFGPPFADPINTAYSSKQPVFTASIDTYNVTGVRRESVVNLVSALGATYEYDALAPIFYPVFDTIPPQQQRHNNNNNNNNEDNMDNKKKKVVAVLRAGIYWRFFFEGMLPASSKGVIVVLESNCGNLYTYQIDGSEAHCLGRGDLHNPKYDHLEAAVTIGNILGLDDYDDGDDDDAGTATTTSSRGQCMYGLRVYPSQELEDQYMTNKPIMFALTLAAVFVVTCVTFLLYDYCVQRRQRIVMKSAQQSGKLVQSLFPEVVRDRLYEEQEAKEKQQQKIANHGAAATTTTTKDDWNHRNHQPEDNGNLSFGDAKPSAIANLYPQCTVLFADIAGFTEWSSRRVPSEVFELLETIYGAFDAIAKKRRVFKIETIGDCYVATTGLPNPQPDHAIIMAKFANECLKKLRILIHAELIDRLGEDTGTLAMRFGLHSGPVTAGVLRGEKARFQIFGDTVNTAARMESNGQREKIQVSQTTADLITEAGKGSWLIKREELVAAKGKGDMQTYWVNIVSAAKSFTSSSVCSGMEFGGAFGDGENKHHQVDV